MPATCRPAISSHSLGRAWVQKLPVKLAYATAAGLSGIELFHEDVMYYASEMFQRNDISSVTPSDRIAACEAISELCSRLHLHVVCLQPFRNYEGLQDRVAHEQKLVDLHTWIKMAHILRTDLIAIASSLLPAEETTGDPTRLAADLAAVADIGAAANPPIRFTYEALCFGTHVQSWEQAWDLVKLANRPNLGLCLDTFNMAGWAYADPAVAGGVRPDGPQRLRSSLEALKREVPAERVFYIQVVDAERMRAPLLKGHPLYQPDQSPRMTWSRGCRLFYGETERGAYMPIEDVMSTIVHGLGWRGWVSMELFNHSLEDPREGVPEEHAGRAMESWHRLVRDFPQLKGAPDPSSTVDGTAAETAPKNAFARRAIEAPQVTLGSRL